MFNIEFILKYNINKTLKLKDLRLHIQILEKRTMYKDEWCTKTSDVQRRVMYEDEWGTTTSRSSSRSRAYIIRTADTEDNRGHYFVISPLFHLYFIFISPLFHLYFTFISLYFLILGSTWKPLQIKETSSSPSYSPP
jgi:hypothetical protein